MPSRFSNVRLFVALQAIAHQVSLSMGFFSQEYWRGLPCLSPGELSDPGIEPVSPVAPALQADSLLLNHRGLEKSQISYFVGTLEKGAPSVHFAELGTRVAAEEGSFFRQGNKLEESKAKRWSMNSR